LPDVVIIGGGVIGSAAAGFLRQASMAPEVTVLEPDPAYAKAASPRSSGGVRQLFTCPENVAMSKYTHEIIGHWQEFAAGPGGDAAAGAGSAAEVPDLAWTQNGYLFIIRDHAAAEAAAAAGTLNGQGIPVDWLSPAQITTRFPLIRVDDVAGALYSPADGWLDPAGFLTGLRQRARRLGTTFVAERAVDFETDGHQITSVRLGSGRRIAADAVINAAGCWAPELAARLGWMLPVEPMRRFAHYVEAPARLSSLPFVKDAAHLAVRSEGAGLLAGVVDYAEPGGFNFSLDGAAGHFQDRVWPALAHRFPVLDELRLKSSMSGLYDQNRFDGNMIIDRGPRHLRNFYLTCGFSGHGLMHAPAVGRALAELLLHGEYQTIDLSRLSYQRIADGRPYREQGII
jgi:FAD-dependent oxidoreductase domain-containing protein 1